jgi:quercetin dioxygenase-like cupin family protein
VICTSGVITLIQEIGGKEVRTTLKPGEYAINPPGVWHTADVSGTATAVFITAGVGTEARPREKK